MLERGRNVRSWLILIAFASGAVWYGAKGIYVEGRQFVSPTATFNVWESGYMLVWWLVAFVGGLALLFWIIRSLMKAGEDA